MYWRWVLRWTALTAASLGSPLFLIKARMQAYSPVLPVGAQHYYKNSWDALSTIVRTDGVKGLWRGVSAAILRTVCVRVEEDLLTRRARQSSSHLTTTQSRSSPPMVLSRPTVSGCTSLRRVYRVWWSARQCSRQTRS